MRGIDKSVREPGVRPIACSRPGCPKPAAVTAPKMLERLALLRQTFPPARIVPCGRRGLAQAGKAPSSPPWRMTLREGSRSTSIRQAAHSAQLQRTCRRTSMSAEIGEISRDKRNRDPRTAREAGTGRGVEQAAGRIISRERSTENHACCPSEGKQVGRSAPAGMVNPAATLAPEGRITRGAHSDPAHPVAHCGGFIRTPAAGAVPGHEDGAVITARLSEI